MNMCFISLTFIPVVWTLVGYSWAFATGEGFAGLVAATILGPRHEFANHAKEEAPHNVPFVILGASLLWFGWFGFNAGSALAANGLASLAFVTTTLAAIFF